MKKFFFALMISPIFVLGTTYHTITIDGNNDFDTATEQFTTTSGTTLYGYITWDASNIYIGISGSSPAGTVTDANRVYHIYLDTDPQQTPTNGTGTTTGVTWRWVPTLPFTANYHYAFKTVDNSEYKDVYSGSWNTTTFATSNWKGAGFWEVSISRSDIGSPSQIYICFYVEEDWDGGYICGGTPSNLFTNTNTSGSITFNNHWLGYTLTSGVDPNSTGADQSLAVSLMSFKANSLENGIRLSWSTASEIENQGFIISRKDLQNQQWQEIASFIDHKELLGHGSSPAGFSYSYTDYKVVPGNTYSYLLSDVDYHGKRTDHYDKIVTVTYTPSEDQTSPGSFRLLSLYPNPFNPVVNIKYELSKPGKVAFIIYNTQGREVWRYSAEQAEKGVHLIRWNGQDLTGRLLPSGVYLFTYDSGAERGLQKLTLLR